MSSSSTKDAEKPAKPPVKVTISIDQAPTPLSKIASTGASKGNISRGRALPSEDATTFADSGMDDFAGAVQRNHRRDTIMAQPGLEGVFASPHSHTGKTLAVFTSGGDSQGMNSAVRAVVRMGLYLGCRVYFIKEGYQGMVDGDEYIVEADWNSVSDIIQCGGTIIGSARCSEFRERPGRLKACENLLKHNITNLVCIGGDGSLTGANQFRIDWPGLLQELVDNGRVPKEKLATCPNINIVGLVGSIDNDFCGTDMTIGTDSALHRIVEAVDAVSATAQSHQRCFVVEVMGRHCGYLALVAGLATEADFIFMPEWPPGSDWKEVLCKKLAFMREQGSRLNIIIVAEGAMDRDLNPITAENVKDVIKERLKYDTRVTVLGHVQRGGNPSAFDRLLGCRMGAEAVTALMEMTPETEPCVISIDGNQMVRVPLMQCVERTKKVQEAMDKRNWEEAAKLRGRSFQRNLETYQLLTKMHIPKAKDELSGGHHFNIGVMNIGAPACGMNAAVRSVVRMSLYHGCNVLGIQDSFDGLMRNKVMKMTWNKVTDWVRHGGSFLGTQKQIPTDKTMPLIAAKLAELHVHALVLVGGFEAYHSALVLAEKRREFREFCIPIIVIPCVISNNVPGTSFSLGSDTALNEICNMIDKIKQSATGTKRRVFIIETMGGYCGYLATIAALSSGADNAYIFEDQFTVMDIASDVEVIAQKMERGVQRYLVIRNEMANKNYTTEFISKLFDEEARGAFTTRVNVLGHMQQGGVASPFDRNQATKLACRAAEHAIQLCRQSVQRDGSVVADSFETAAVLGILDRQIAFSPVQQLAPSVDFEHRLPRNQWWLKVRPLLRILSKHMDAAYDPESVVEHDSKFDHEAI